MPYYNNSTGFLYGVSGFNISTVNIAEQHLYNANNYYVLTSRFPGYSAVRLSRFYSANSASEVLYPNVNMSFNNFESGGSSNTWVYNQNVGFTGGGGLYQSGVKQLGKRGSGSISFGNFAHSYKGSFLSQYRWVGKNPTLYNSNLFTLLDDPVVANTGNSFQLSNSLTIEWIYQSGSNSYVSFMSPHSNGAAIQLNYSNYLSLPVAMDAVTDSSNSSWWGGNANNVDGGWRPNQMCWSGNAFVFSLTPYPKTALANSVNRGVVGYAKMTPVYGGGAGYGGWSIASQIVLTANNCGFANTEFMRLVTQGAYYQNGMMESDGAGNVLDIIQQVYIISGSQYGTVNVINGSSDGGATWSNLLKTAGTNTTTANGLYSANGYVMFSDLCYAAGNVNQFVAISSNRNSVGTGNTALEQAVWRGSSSSFSKIGTYTMDNGSPQTNAEHYILAHNFGGTGNGYLLGISKGNSSPTYAISKSINGGSTWTTVNANPWSASANGTAVQAHMNAGTGGRTGFHNLVYNTLTSTWIMRIYGYHPTNSSNNAVYFATSTDDGVTWSWPDYFYDGNTYRLNSLGKRMRKSWLGYNFGMTNINGLANNVQLVGITPGYGSFNSIATNSGYA